MRTYLIILKIKVFWILEYNAVFQERGGKKNHSREGNFISQSRISIGLEGGVFVFLNE